jgi:pheromone shutdown protein TraB
MYRALNAAGAGEQVFHSDFGAALEEPSPQRYGRIYAGAWETRNLRMAANIREVMAARPGMRMLVIVGASHKAYLDAYLNQMHDVSIINTGALLRAD